MSKAFMGADVLYGGHEGTFIADIWRIGNVNVVRASREVTPNNIDRSATYRATHHMSDYPESGFWRPDLGIFVVLESQVIETEFFKEEQKRRKKVKQRKGVRV